MKPHQANLINALILIGLGLWGYFTGAFSAGKYASTALIAPTAGIILLLMNGGLKRENKAIAHVVVLLTLLLLLALFMPFSKQEGLPKMRTGIMMFSCLVATAVFIKSFIDARKAKA